MAETGIPTRQQVYEMLRERQGGRQGPPVVNLPRRPTLPQLPQPQAQAPVYNLDRAMAALGAGIPEPTQGGVMGVLGKVLGAIDIPRAVVTSGLQEVVDAIQGEGFSGSDFMQQVRDHHGFGDILADMNVDFGLGGWGNRIVGFTGDVLTDPLAWTGGLGAFARARGAKGLINDVAVRTQELSGLVKAGKATAKQSLELNALNDAVTAAGKYRTVSSARNALMQHGEVGQQLVKDLGIETGLRFRVPGTGPILGRLSRRSSWVAGRRAGQIPEMVAARIRQELPDNVTLKELVRKSMRREPLDSGLSADIREVVARAANVPVDTLPFGVFPIVGGVTARIMGSPGVGFEKVATSKVGQSFKRYFVDDQKQMLNTFRRSGKPDDVIVGNLFRSAYNRGATIHALWADEAQRTRQGFLNNIRREFDITDDMLLDEMTRISEELADDILAGRPISRAAQNMFEEVFPGADPKVVASVKKAYQTRVSDADVQFLFRDDLFGESANFARDVDDVLLAYGTYTPHIYSDRGRTIFEAMRVKIREGDGKVPYWLEELLSDADAALGQTGKTVTEQTSRVASRHTRRRAFRPDHVDAAGERVRGGPYEIPLRDGPGVHTFDLRRPYGHSVDAPASSKGVRGARDLTDAEKAGRGKSNPNVVDAGGRSVQRQVDDAFRAAGWLDEGESLWIRGFAERERAYISSMTREVRMRAIEAYAAKRGVLFASEGIEELLETLGKIETRGREIQRLWNSLDDEEKARIAARNAVLHGEGATSRSFTVENIARWLGKNVEDGEKVANQIADTQVQMMDAYAEAGALVDELHDLANQVNRLVTGATGDSIPKETLLRTIQQADVETPAGFTIDAVRELLPIVDDLDKILARYTVLAEATQRVNRLREQMIAAYVGTPGEQAINAAFDGMGRLSTELEETLKYVDEALLPVLRDSIGSAMSHDRSVQALVKVMDAALAAGAGSVFPPTQAMNRFVRQFGRLFYSEEAFDMGAFLGYTPPAAWGTNRMRGSTSWKMQHSLEQSAHPNKAGIARVLDDLKKFSDDVFRRTGERIEPTVAVDVSVTGVRPTVHVAGRLSPEDGAKLSRIMERWLGETVYFDAQRSGLMGRVPRSNRLRLTGDEAGVGRMDTTVFHPIRTDVASRATLTPNDFSDVMNMFDELERVLNHQYLQSVLDNYSTVEERLAATLAQLNVNAVEVFGDENALRGWLRTLTEPPIRGPGFEIGVSPELSQLGRAAGAVEGPGPTVELGRILERMDTIWGNRAAQEGSLFAQYGIIDDLKTQIGRRPGTLSELDEGAGLLKRRARIENARKVNAGRLDRAWNEAIDNEQAITDILIQKNQLQLQLMDESMQAQADALRSASGLFGPDNGKLFNLNSFGGSIDFDNMTVEMLQDLFADARHTWGAWRIGGDDRFASQVQEAMLAAQKMNDKKQVEGLLRAFDKTHNWMKAQMVATPGFVTRNVMGGMTNMWFAGIPLTETLKTGKLLQRAYRAGDGDLLRGARQLLDKTPGDQTLSDLVDLLHVGAHAGGQAASTVDSALLSKAGLDFVYGMKGGKRIGRRVNLNPADAGFVLYSSVRHANTFAEEMMRVATGLHTLRVGGNVDDALETIYRLHFNYGDLSKWERGVGRRLFPFYTWTRNNLPLQMEFAARYPRRFNQLNSLKRNLEYGEEREGMVPDYFLKPFGIQLPFSIGGATAYSVPDMPFQDLMRFDPTSEGAGRAVEQLASGLTPMLKAPVEYWAGKQVFAGIKYTGRFQKVPTTMSKVPGLMPILGSLGFAEKNSAGDWMMQDSRIGLIDNLLPYIGRLRRVLPSEERYQERYLQTLLSTLAGVSLRLNTPQQQENALLRRQIEESLRQRNLVDVETGRR